MSWTEDQLERLQKRMIEARRAGAWISAGEASLVTILVQVIRRLTRGTGWSGIPDGRLPTVGNSKRQGIVKFTVHCATPQCWASRRFSFEELDLADDVVFVDIPRVRRFVCRKCRGRNVTLMADWPAALKGTPGLSHLP